MKQVKAYCIALFLMCAMIPMNLYAASFERAVLKGKDNQVFATLTQLDQKDDIRSLQLSFQVKVVKGTVQEKDISFQFDKALSSEVKEYRYHHDTGMLTVYISGIQDLYTSEALELGSVTIAKNSNAVVEVNVIEDSFRAVQDDTFKNDGAPVQVGKAVKIATGNMIDQEPEQPDVTDPDDDQNKNDQKDDQNQIDPGKPDTGNQPDQGNTDEPQESGSYPSKEEETKDAGSTETGDTSNLTFFALSTLGAVTVMGILTVLYQKINQK